MKLLNSIRETNGFLGLITFMLVAYMLGNVINQFRRNRQASRQDDAEAQRLAAAQQANDDQFKRLLDIIIADRNAAREERAVQAERDKEHNAQIGRLAEGISSSVKQMAETVRSFGELRESVDTSLVAAKADRDAAAGSRQQLHAEMQRTNSALDASQNAIARLEEKIHNLVTTIQTDCSRDYTPQLTVITNTMLEIQRRLLIAQPAIPALVDAPPMPGDSSSATK